MPNSGNSVLMPPSGSVTPMISTAPHAATMMAVQTHAPTRHEVSLKRGTTLPRESCSMNRATRVPASTAVRMNSASNMIAKWCQKPMSASPPTSWPMMCARPTARVGVPPVRAAGEFMAKWMPRSSETAATSAMTATKASMSMPP